MRPSPARTIENLSETVLIQAKRIAQLEQALALAKSANTFQIQGEFADNPAVVEFFRSSYNGNESTIANIRALRKQANLPLKEALNLVKNYQERIAIAKG